MRKNFLPKELLKILFSSYRKESYAQEAEDLILQRLFEEHKGGFYVDIGAHHPFRFSNTQLLYRRGWSGINIDAMPGSMELFNLFRRRDINLELGISKTEGELKYHMFQHPALNTFSEDMAQEREGHGAKVQKVISVKTIPLAKLLEEHLPEGMDIDFMNVDVEGMDLEVLKTNDWDRYKPKVIIAESIGASLEEIGSDPVYIFLKSKGYSIYAKSVNSVIYKL